MTVHGSRSDRQRRTAALVAERGLDSLLVSSPASIGYLAGVNTRSFIGAPIARLSADGSLLILVAEADRPSLAAAGYDGDVETWPGQPGERSAAQALTTLWHDSGHAAAEGRVLRPFAGDKVELSGREIIAEATRTKDDDEIELLRSAANLADIAYTATVDRLHPELRAYEIVRNVDRSVRAAGGGGWWSPAESDDELESTAAFPSTGIVRLLDRVPETGVLDREAPLSFDLLPLYEAYAGASGTTVVFRSPDPATRESASRLAGALHEVLAALAPGASGGAVHERFRAEAGRAGATLVGFSSGTGPGEVLIAGGSTATVTDRSVITLRASAPGTGVFFQTTVLVTGHGAERLDVVVPLRLIELH